MSLPSQIAMLVATLAVVLGIGLAAAGAASAHPDVPRQWLACWGCTGVPWGVTVQGDQGKDPVSGPCIPDNGTPDHNPVDDRDTSYTVSSDQRARIQNAFSRTCERPRIIDLNWCKSNTGWSKKDCAIHTAVYDHNWTFGDGKDRANPVGSWEDETHFRQCMWSDCKDEAGIANYGGDVQFEWNCGWYWWNNTLPWCSNVWWVPEGAKDPMTNQQLPDYVDFSNGFYPGAGARMHPLYESHHWFFVAVQAQDGWKHASEYCSGTMPNAPSWRWVYGDGDCSFPASGGHSSAAFASDQGNCGCGYGSDGNRDADGPYRPDYSPWRPAMGGIWRHTTSATPFRTLNHSLFEDPANGQKGLYSWYSDRDGQQYPWEGVFNGNPGKGEATLKVHVRRIGGGFSWNAQQDNVPEEGLWTDASNHVQRPGKKWETFSIMRNSDPDYAPGKMPEYLPNGQYQWWTVGYDHHDLNSTPSNMAFFQVATPGARQCGAYTFRYLCDLTDTQNNPPSSPVSYYDDTGPDGFTTSAAPGDANGGPNIFEYDTMQQNSAVATGNTTGSRDASGCDEKLINPSGALSYADLNAVMKVRLNVTRFDTNSGGSSGATASSSMRGIFTVGQREDDPTYLEGLDCIQ